LKSQFSQSLFATLHWVFDSVYYKDVNNKRVWNMRTNFVISNKEITNYSLYTWLKSGWDIYYDNKNSIELDLFEMR
jgi:hypothetical protein